MPNTTEMERDLLTIEALCLAVESQIPSMPAEDRPSWQRAVARARRLSYRLAALGVALPGGAECRN